MRAYSEPTRRSSVTLAAPPAGLDAATTLQLRLARLRGRHPLEVAELGDQQLFGAASVPVVMVGAAEPPHVLDDRVLLADRDVAVTAGAVVELAGDTAD